jgi:hypothetical protein
MQGPRMMRHGRRWSWLTLPCRECRGFLVRRADLPSSPLEEDSRGHLSPSVRASCLAPVPVCPTVQQRNVMFSPTFEAETVRCVCALLRDLTLLQREFLDSGTLVLLPKGAFDFGTRRNTIPLSNVLSI